MPWIVATTKANCEAQAEFNLDRQGFESYLPRHLIKIPNKNPVRKCLFPGYIFIMVGNVWYSLTGTRGISRVLMGDDGPQRLPDSVVDGLRQRENQFGLVVLEPAPKYAPGQALRAKAGPLVGIHLIYEGMSARDRVRVLVNMFGQTTRAEVADQNLVPA